jgi:peptide/nickel transport system ATP-binding protein
MDITQSPFNDADKGGPAQPLLVVQNLRKRFLINPGFFEKNKQYVHAVDDVSFSVGKGKTLGIVGESGCGKSTTAKLVARLIKADRGSMIFDGEGVDEYGGIELKEFRRKLQMVFQDSYASLNPRLTIEQTISFGPQVHGVAKDKATELARSLIDRVGLLPKQYAHRYPHELSGGQRQRVNIARALAFQPRLIILDEAVAALDKSVQAQVLNLLQDLKKERELTYLFISHDLHVVQYLSDEVMVMYLGQVIEHGPVERIFNSPAHPYTKALLSAIPSMDPNHKTWVSPLSGDPPNPINPGVGCRFRDRCSQAHSICHEITPSLSQVSGTQGHTVACHLNQQDSLPKEQVQHA